MTKKSAVAKKAGSRYLYVEVRGWFNNDGLLDGPVSLYHIFITALTADRAYQLGAVEIDERLDDGTPDPHFSGDFLNDYVVKLDE